MKKEGNKLLIVVPAYNEGWNLINLESDFKEKNEWDVLLVNDASTDRTSSLAKKVSKVKVLNLPFNLGIGGSVQTGFKYALKHNYEIVVQFDGDGQHLIAEIPRLKRLIDLEKADVVIGSRFVKKVDGFRSTRSRRFGISMLNYLAMFLIKQKITDCTSGFRAYNRKAVRFLAETYPTDYPEPEAIVLLGKNGFKISEVHTEMRKRQGGNSSLVGQGAFYMIKVMLGMIMTASRRKIN